MNHVIAEDAKKESIVKALRAEKGLSQKALAFLAGVNIRQIQKIEAGEIQIQNITLGTAKRLSDALGIEISDLLK